MLLAAAGGPPSDSAKLVKAAAAVLAAKDRLTRTASPRALSSSTATTSLPVSHAAAAAGPSCVPLLPPGRWLHTSSSIMWHQTAPVAKFATCLRPHESAPLRGLRMPQPRAVPDEALVVRTPQPTR